MIRRRFVNLVAENNSTRVLSLHRLDVAKNLFYPSTAKADATNAAKENNNGGGGKPPRIGSLRRLPPPSLFFERLSGSCGTCDRGRRPEDDRFVLVSPHNSEGKILQVGDHAILHDVDSGSTTTMPGIQQPPGYWTIFSIASIAGAGAGASAGTGTERKGGGEGGSLYVMTNEYRHYMLQSSFQVLDLSQHPHKWAPLPLPPFAVAGIKSFTVVDGGHTICTSTDSNCTYCFDTRSHDWWKVGDWALPFNYGRVEHVPELETWLGFCPKHYQFGHSYHSYQLCATGDLSAMDDAHRAPTLQHVWEDLNTPTEEETIELKRKGFRGVVLSSRKDWSLLSCDLINLGGGRFCIAKFFRVENRIVFHLEDEPMDEYELVVLSGVEVVRGGGDEGGLRMVKHKSKRYMFDSDRIKWVL